MPQIDLTIDETNALLNLMDAGLKSLGLQSAIPTAVILQKIQNAQAREVEQQNSKLENRNDPSN